MDTMLAFAKGEANRGKPMRVFDWDEAARRIVAANATEAGAGLSQDWDYTGGDILRDGKPVPREYTYTYLESTWAIPELTLDDGSEEPCWIWSDESPDWDARTYWPDSALKILSGGAG